MTQISYPSFFHRPPLMARIREALARPLLFVVAPIGYGKTMTMREALPAQASWQTLMSDSSSLFWEKVGAFLRPFSDALADRMAEMRMPSSEMELDGILSYFDTLSFGEPTYLVLDDCHVLKDPMAWRFVELLARQQLKNLHVVLLSRNRLPLALEDLLLKGLAAEIGSRELSFSAEDILGFFRQSGLKISTDDSQLLFDATDGWISAVYLYALSYISYVRHKESAKEKGQFSDFFENYENEPMYRLLEETVYRTCSEDEKKFLVALCGFDGFTLDAVDFIMERVPGVQTPPRQVLKNLLNSNSFLRRNALENRYEVHPVLLRFLRKRLSLQPQKVQDFAYDLRGDWYIHVGEPLTAVRWYLAGHRYEKLLNLFVTQQEIFNHFEQKDLLIRCFTECPESVKRRHLLACLLCAKSFLLFSEPSLFKRTLFEVQAIVNDLAPGMEKNWAQGELEILLSFTCFADLPEMYDHLMRATFLMGGKPSRVVDRYFPFGFGANALLTLVYNEPGSLSEIKQTFSEIMPVYMTLVPGGGDGAVEMLSAEAAYCQGDWNASYDLVHEAMDKAMESGQKAVALMGYHLLLQLALIHGDYREYELVQKELHRAVQSAERRELRQSAQITLAGGLLLSKGNLSQLPEWLLHGRFYSEELLPPVCLCAFMRYARVLMEQESYSIFLSFYRDMENLHRRYPSSLMMIYADIYRAAALSALGDQEEAEEAIAAALKRAQPDRLYVPFMQNLKYLEKLLPFLHRKNPDFIETVETLWANFERGTHALAPALTLSNLFTDRENQIITYLKRGYTNKQIAAELFIAEITVKKNMARIAEKLNVKGRMNILRALSENERRGEGR